MSGEIGTCQKCNKNGSYIMPLHGDKGGPMFCPFCAGEWHGEHGKRRKYGRIVIKAMKSYVEIGSGKWWDIAKLKDSAMYSDGLGAYLHLSGGSLARFTDPLGYGADSIGADVGDITSELLNDTLQLTHPDRHPPERQELAKRVTAELLALKPFVFPAPKPEPPPIYKPRDTSKQGEAAPLKEPSREPAYPCEACASTVPYYYCTPCKTRWDDDRRKEREAEREKQRAQYRRHKERRDRLRKPTPCQSCGAEFKGKRKDARFCSAACRQKAHRVTHKESATAKLFIAVTERIALKDQV